MLAAGQLDDQFLVPRTKDRKEFSSILKTLGLTKISTGYPRHNVIRAQNRTYVVEGNTYEFAKSDFLFVFSGNADDSFSLDCVLDPQVYIPDSPPNLIDE